MRVRVTSGLPPCLDCCRGGFGAKLTNAFPTTSPPQADFFGSIVNIGAMIGAVLAAPLCNSIGALMTHRCRRYPRFAILLPSPTPAAGSMLPRPFS